EAEQLEAGGGHAGDARAPGADLVDLVAVPPVGVVDEEGHGVQGVTCLYHRPPGDAVAKYAALTIPLEHLVGVPVIRRDHQDPPHAVHQRLDAAELEIHGLHGHHGGVEVAGVADHVAVGQV